MKPDDIRARALFLKVDAPAENEAALIRSNVCLPARDYESVLEDADQALIGFIAENGISEAAKLMERFGSETLDDLSQEELSAFIRVTAAYRDDVDEAIHEAMGRPQGIDHTKIWENFNRITSGKSTK